MRINGERDSSVLGSARGLDQDIYRASCRKSSPRNRIKNFSRRTTISRISTQDTTGDRVISDHPPNCPGQKL